MDKSRSNEWRNRKRVSVIGSGKCGPEVYEMAKELGKELALKGYALVCGGMGGVMQGVCEGAKSAGGLTMGILPTEDKSTANDHVDVLVATPLSHMRNYLVVLNGDVVVALEGETGTLSELALALKSGKQVIALGCYSGMEGVIPARNPQEAVTLVEQILRPS